MMLHCIRLTAQLNGTAARVSVDGSVVYCVFVLQRWLFAFFCSNCLASEDALITPAHTDHGANPVSCRRHVVKLLLALAPLCVHNVRFGMLRFRCNPDDQSLTSSRRAVHQFVVAAVTKRQMLTSNRQHTPTVQSSQHTNNGNQKPQSQTNMRRATKQKGAAEARQSFFAVLALLCDCCSQRVIVTLLVSCVIPDLQYYLLTRLLSAYHQTCYVD